MIKYTYEIIQKLLKENLPYNLISLKKDIENISEENKLVYIYTTKSKEFLLVFNINVKTIESFLQTFPFYGSLFDNGELYFIVEEQNDDTNEIVKIIKYFKINNTSLKRVLKQIHIVQYKEKQWVEY